MKRVNNRKGCPTFVTEVQPESNVFVPYINPPKLVYHETKLTHTGISTYKVFENCSRNLQRSSKQNLIQNRSTTGLIDNLFPKDYSKRHLNATQSRKIKKYSSKLAYYSKVRKHVSTRSGNYKYKVSFLTLTAPEVAEAGQILKAFEHFLDYIRRTANCVYVWKKELGEKNKHLHIHLLLNNFIPYYIVSWKWQRLLMAEGVQWPLNDKGKPTNAHTRIELPKNKRLIAHYIAKYMSKAFELPKEYGYISGHSEVLEDLKEVTFIESELPIQELQEICKHYKTIKDTFITHTCVDLLQVKDIAPVIFEYFRQQYEGFKEMISLPERDWSMTKKLVLSEVATRP
jgi:hypothetical protein